MYKWPAFIVARLTPAQQLMYLSEKAVKDVVQFSTMEEYEKWMQTNVK